MIEPDVFMEKRQVCAEYDFIVQNSLECLCLQICNFWKTHLGSMVVLDIKSDHLIPITTTVKKEPFYIKPFRLSLFPFLQLSQDIS